MTDTNTLPAEAKKRILIVEDSPAMRFSMRDVLSKHGYCVLEAEDGMEALAILEKEPNVGLVVTDLYMPRLDGLGLLRQLRRNLKYAELPVIIQTTEAQAALVSKARQSGATGWLIKPINGQALMRAVDYLLKVRAPTADNR